MYGGDSIYNAYNISRLARRRRGRVVKLLRLRRAGIFYTEARTPPESTSKFIFFFLFKFNFIVMFSFMIFKSYIYLIFLNI